MPVSHTVPVSGLRLVCACVCAVVCVVRFSEKFTLMRPNKKMCVFPVTDRP